MSSSAEAVQRQLRDREGLSPSSQALSPGVITIADLLDEENDDTEFEPSTEQDDTSDGAAEEGEDDDDVYVGMA